MDFLELAAHYYRLNNLLIQLQRRHGGSDEILELLKARQEKRRRQLVAMLATEKEIAGIEI